ncbi:MAG: D-alanine--D-alanine ligase [Crocinitomicaceae bacterium]|nr:D-alanine--D-alanine ligase [Crocinitomicaceae bacterium]
MKNVGIICGGFSSEFDISVKSARNILENFPDGFAPFLVLLRKTGWNVLLDDTEVPLNSKDFTFLWDREVTKIDLSIVYVHGDPGENGKIQAYLDMIDMPYVNSGPLASQLSFDKWYCNQFLSGFDIPVAKSLYLTNAKEELDIASVVNELGLPLFVKPCDSGSSYGIAKVKDVDQLQLAVNDAFKEGETVVVESFLDGTEVTCGLYNGNHGVTALPLTEIVSKNDFFDFEAKYQGLSDEITPARIKDEVRDDVQELSKKIYSLLKLRSIARIDFMLVNDIPYVIEVNTTPGFSNESIVPKMIEASGKTVKECWAEILAVEIG